MIKLKICYFKSVIAECDKSNWCEEIEKLCKFKFALENEQPESCFITIERYDEIEGMEPIVTKTTHLAIMHDITKNVPVYNNKIDDVCYEAIYRFVKKIFDPNNEIAVISEKAIIGNDAAVLPYINFSANPHEDNEFTLWIKKRWFPDSKIEEFIPLIKATKERTEKSTHKICGYYIALGPIEKGFSERPYLETIREATGVEIEEL